MQWTDGKIITVNPEIHEVDFDNNETSLDNVLFAIKGDIVLKPILRPLSDLTKEIEVNGVKFVPIVEIAKIAGLKPYEGKRRRYKIEEGCCVNIKHCEHYGTLQSFAFYPKMSSFRTTLDGYKPFNQYELLQKFFEWHIDVFNLIPDNLAIDINTLKENEKSF